MSATAQPQSNWTADPQSVLELATLLKNSMSPDHVTRTTAMDSLRLFEQQPEFLNYLCYILIEGEQDPTLQSSFPATELANYRASAGMLLKNTMQQQQRQGQAQAQQNRMFSSARSVEYVKRNIIHGLYNSSSPLVTNVTGIVITTLFSTYYRQHRDDPSGIELLSQLLELSAANNLGGIKALSKIIEDNGEFFQLEWKNKEGNEVKPIEVLVQQLLLFIDAESLSAEVRAESIKCLNFIIRLRSQFFIVHIDEFLTKLFRLAEADSSEAVQTELCGSFTNLLETRPDKLLDNLDGIVQFMLHLISTASQHENVAIGACEFLHEFVVNEFIPKHVVQNHVNLMVPVLLAKMVYNEEAIMVYEANNESDANIEDKDEDIRPMAPRIVKRRKDHGLAKAKNEGEDEGEEEVEGGDDGEGDDFEDDDEVDSGWSLRKCSAATLDALTNVLPRDVIEVAFPYLREHLTAEQWFVREATILALGAMAEGGVKYFSDQLYSLIPFLVEQLKDHWAPIRRITCWTLSRFSQWILSDHTEFLVPVLEAIMKTLFDNKKDVQEAAISSVAIFIENSDPELLETVLYTELLQSFDRCFQIYKKKNLIILYDAVSRLAEKVELEETGMQVLLPHLISKWQSLPDNDKELWPLLECLSCVAASLGEKFGPMASDVYDRTYKILLHCIETEQAAQKDPNVALPEKDFIITSLDLIDGIVQGLGAKSQPLLFPENAGTTTANNNLLQLMLVCVQDPVHEVRQSTFALLGDIVTYYSPQVLQGALSQFLKYIGFELMHNDDIDGEPAVVNAVWCLGIISERIDLSEYVLDLSRVLVDLFTSTLVDISPLILENLAITIGRMGITHPEVFSNDKFASDSQWNKWSDLMNTVEAVDEKSSGYMGFLRIANMTNPETVKVTPGTLAKIIEGLSSKNVEIEPFAQDILNFLVNHSAQLQSMTFNDEQMEFLRRFS